MDTHDPNWFQNYIREHNEQWDWFGVGTRLRKLCTEHSIELNQALDEVLEAINRLEASSQPQVPTLLRKEKEIEDEKVEDEPRALECKICNINKVCVVLTRCGHIFCHTCVKQFENKCATCRKTFISKNVLRVYF